MLNACNSLERHFNTGKCGYVMFPLKKKFKISKLSIREITVFSFHGGPCIRNLGVFSPFSSSKSSSYVNTSIFICLLTSLTAFGVRHWIFSLTGSPYSKRT